jgi:predicted nuclease of restriction endonuclease-like (RecB) superfamily
MAKELKTGAAYPGLVDRIGELLELGRQRAGRAVNTILVQTYWEIGRHIVEFEQGGSDRAAYGESLLDRLSHDLTERYGKGFRRSNLFQIRQFYSTFSKIQTLSELFEQGSFPEKLSWSHFAEIIKADNELEVGFYVKQCALESWSVRELKRQMKSMLFHRLALSKDKKGVLELAQQGQQVMKPSDIIRDPYVLEFLQIPHAHQYLEGELEQKLSDNLQTFLLELGKGFAFIGRQYRIQIGSRQFFVDLVFYHRILKCFVLIDLKRGEVEHGDVGQMNLYLNYFRIEENTEGDNEPIGIVLGAYKDRILVEYATENISNQLFVSKYQLYLPDKEALVDELERVLDSGKHNEI